MFITYNKKSIASFHSIFIFILLLSQEIISKSFYIFTKIETKLFIFCRSVRIASTLIKEFN